MKSFVSRRAFCAFCLSALVASFPTNALAMTTVTKTLPRTTSATHVTAPVCTASKMYGAIVKVIQVSLSNVDTALGLGPRKVALVNLGPNGSSWQVIAMTDITAQDKLESGETITLPISHETYDDGDRFALYFESDGTTQTLPALSISVTFDQ